MSIERAAVRIDTDSSFRPSEIMGDLRIVAETLYFPMRLVGFWDETSDSHMCPETEVAKPCPHLLDEGDSGFVPYFRSMQRYKGAAIEVTFPHARVRMYLS